jgi:hypothetical protein
MAFKYKLAESKPHPEEANILRKELEKWNKEWDEKQSELSQALQDKIKNITEKVLSEKKCWDGYEAQGKKIKDGKSVNDCRPIKK